MLRFIFCLALLPISAQAEEWVVLDQNADIFAALEGQTVRYGPLTFQVFNADGDTQYITERFSEGQWEAREGRYCSVWPPSEIWTCYDFQQNGDRVRFISDGGVVSEGVYEE